MGLKLRTQNRQSQITMDDIHVRAGGTSGDEFSQSETDAAGLGFLGTATTQRTFTHFHNKWRIDTGSYFTTDGYFESFMGSGPLGSMTENIFASSNDGGWYWGTSATEARLTQLVAYTSGSNNPSFSAKWVDNSDGSNLPITQGWFLLSVRDNAGPTVYYRAKSTYASFNSGTGTWNWSNSVSNMTTIFPQSAGTRFLELD
jgi:hypothetical protein